MSLNLEQKSPRIDLKYYKKTQRSESLGLYVTVNSLSKGHFTQQ